MNPHASGKRLFLIALALAAVIVALYARTARYDFVYYDDNAYVFRNAHVQQGMTPESIRWALTTTENSLWLPLTRLSFLADAQVAGMNPGWFHLENVFLLAITAILLFLLLNSLTGTVWRSAAAAALFSLHPLRVESVAWITERKDMLAMVFLLLSVMAYVRYARSGSRRAYAGSVGLFLASLAAKPMGVMLPLLLPVLDFWPLGRFGSKNETVENVPKKKKGRQSSSPSFQKLIREKIPYLAAAILITIITIIANRGALKPDDLVPAGTRLANAAVSCIRYLGNMFWPHNLTFYYPFDTGLLGVTAVAGSLAALAAITAAVIVFRKKAPYLAVGWAWYLIALLPFIGIVQAGSQSMADRFTFLPMIGVTVALVWGVAELSGRLRIPSAANIVLFAAAACALSTATYAQIGTWRDSEILFTHALAVTENNYIANLNLANLYLSQGDTNKAVPLYQETLRIRPDSGAANFNMGNILLGEGRYEQAISYLYRALPQFTDNPVIHLNLARALQNIGRLEEANSQLIQAERLQGR